MIIASGVTAGVDMALVVMSQIAGVDFAQTVQLAIENVPEPPFDCGRPDPNAHGRKSRRRRKNLWTDYVQSAMMQSEGRPSSYGAIWGES